MQLGEKIRSIRQKRQMTLDQLSALSGVAKATLSRIENGLMIGTIKSHMKICDALQVSLADLYRPLLPGGKSIELESATEKKDVFVHDEKSFSILLTSQVLSKKMMPILIRLAPEGTTPKEEASNGTEKFLYCIAGNVEVTVGGKKLSTECW